jgi:hypothetical protein
MIAKALAWAGPERKPEPGWSGRWPQTQVIIEGGRTDKAFLRTLLPTRREGTVRC